MPQLSHSVPDNSLYRNAANDFTDFNPAEMAFGQCMHLILTMLKERISNEYTKTAKGQIWLKSNRA